MGAIGFNRTKQENGAEISRRLLTKLGQANYNVSYG